MSGRREDSEYRAYLRVGNATLSFDGRVGGTFYVDGERYVFEPEPTLAHAPTAPTPHGTHSMENGEGTTQRTEEVGAFNRPQAGSTVPQGMPLCPPEPRPMSSSATRSPSQPTDTISVGQVRAFPPQPQLRDEVVLSDLQVPSRPASPGVQPASNPIASPHTTQQDLVATPLSSAAHSVTHSPLAPRNAVSPSPQATAELVFQPSASQKTTPSSSLAGTRQESPIDARENVTLSQPPAPCEGTPPSPEGVIPEAITQTPSRVTSSPELDPVQEPPASMQPQEEKRRKYYGMSGYRRFTAEREKRRKEKKDDDASA